MSVIKSQIRSGVYYDSAVLMQLQRSLAGLEGVVDAGVMMGTETNKELFQRIDLLTPEVEASKENDLVIVVRADDDAKAEEAIGKVDELLSAKKASTKQTEARPRDLVTANELLPESSWTLVSVAGRFAARVANEAMDLGKHVFLFSDNVPVEQELQLKNRAAQEGLLVMGPDCGTAIINGVGLGFANAVRKGPIGMVAAAGTGLQQVSARIHQLGGGLTFGIGTGGRDLKDAVGGKTFLMGLDVLVRDPETKVIVLVSKPPAPAVADKVIRQAKKAGKPVVICFIGRTPITRHEGNLVYAYGMDDAAALAVDLAKNADNVVAAEKFDVGKFAPTQKYLRGLFSGGTLAYEAQHLLTQYVSKVWANAPIKKENQLPDALISQEHTIVDLGEDEFTVGRLHPMMDNELRIRRLLEEAADQSVAVIMMDVVIGFGSHEDPASEIAPAIVKAKKLAADAGRYLEVAVVATGTNDDPQVLDSQIRQLREAGAWVDPSNEAVVDHVGEILQAIEAGEQPNDFVFTPIDIATLKKPVEALNVGLESFAKDLEKQSVPVVHLDWKPLAGGNEKLIGILERVKKFF